ncbi:hypothetical protein [Halocatena salina]|uniref:Uncharacterized protein n=1 Tax=Halocatena salina TaxID=2934340 RepID=A0A8U0A039_9EURY|nr:hypothetical protein [Halocatena salina]UPM42414.1 hypothetical protein MW046_10665 [Halocatena salina]
MSDDPDPCQSCSKLKHQFESSANVSRLNSILGVIKTPFVKTGELSDKIHSSKFIEEICANPGCSEGQGLLQDKLNEISEGSESGWNQIDEDDIDLLEQFSEGALDLVDENGIEWEDGQRRSEWAGIEDKIDELDESFTEQAPEDIALWGVENAPSPGIKKIPRIAEALSNLHETRIEIKREQIQEQIDGIATYEELEEIKGESYNKEITAGLEQTKGNVRELNEIRERLGTYRNDAEFDPLEDLSENENKSWQAQKAELITEYKQLQQLKEIEEQRQPHVDEEWYDEQYGYREPLIEERIPFDVEKNDGIAEDLPEESATTENEGDENEQEQSDELQQVKQEKQSLEKSLQQERDEKQRLRGENEELRDKNQDLQDDLQAVRDEHTTLQEKIQTSSEEHQQQGIETNTTDPQNDSSDRSTNSPVATATAKLRGGLAKSTGAVRKVGAKLRGRLSRTPDKPYPAQHATNIHTTAADTNTSSTQTRDEQQERSATNDRTTNRATEQNRTNGHERTNRRDSKRNEPDRGLF